QIISIQSGNTVIQNVIRSVNSDTELVLAFAPSVNLDNANYVISTTVPDTVSDGVRHICAINAYIILFLQNMDRWMSENGKVEVEMPNGQKVTLDSIRALQAGVEGKLVKEQNGADIPNKPEFVKNLLFLLSLWSISCHLHDFFHSRKRFYYYVHIKYTDPAADENKFT
ncbi:hypothetical protein KKI98_21690, partial [Xenorhabdus bovienii]|nr:hypothetical protein [Xenorhabdus bovienii]